MGNCKKWFSPVSQSSQWHKFYGARLFYFKSPYLTQFAWVAVRLIGQALEGWGLHFHNGLTFQTPCKCWKAKKFPYCPNVRSKFNVKFQLTNSRAVTRFVLKSAPRSCVSGAAGKKGGGYSELFKIVPSGARWTLGPCLTFSKQCYLPYSNLWAFSSEELPTLSLVDFYPEAVLIVLSLSASDFWASSALLLG